ncbi:MAG: hypothetical protein JNM90_14405 [Burkholderiales bacterium]|nr:hypothetical protein [Burkholderiales bacterium]
MALVAAADNAITQIKDAPAVPSPRFAGPLLLALAGSASAAPFHEFCVTRSTPGGPEVSRARLYFSGTDPGKEAAGLHLVRHFRHPQSVVVHVDENIDGTCRIAPTHHVVLNDVAPPAAAGRVKTTPPNLRDISRQASDALTDAATEASRLMCRFLPC